MQPRRMRMKMKSCGLLVVLCVAASLTWADSLQLRNGSLINGKFVGGTESEISFQVGSTVQKYDVADIVSLKFGSEIGEANLSTRESNPRSSDTGTKTSTS